MNTAVPSAFSLTVGETARRLSLDGPRPRPDLAWVRLDALDLDLGPGGPPRATNGHGDAAALEHLKTRRLSLRAATLATDAPRLQEALDRCVAATSGFSALRVWFGAGTPWLGGRVALGNREAPFTIRVAVAPRATGPRHVGLFLGDVRLYAPLPLPAPLVGAALARAIVAGCGGPTARLAAADGGLDLAPLDLALVSALVASGWRLPDLTTATLRSITTQAATLTLAFGAGNGDETAANRGWWLEGERLAEELAPAERALFAGDVRAAEALYRARLAAQPHDRGALARVVALATPSATAEFHERARTLTAAWPDFIPGWLSAAVGAWQADDHETAAAGFTRAAELAAARGEIEDARLAREAAATIEARNRPTAAPRSNGQPPAVVTEAAVPRPIEPADAGNITDRTEAVYAAKQDTQSRNGALGELLRDFDRLSPEQRRAAYASFGRVAESTGDLERAEEAYWRGTHVDGQPDQRAAFLLAHARLLLSRGNDRAAIADLDEALRIAPDASRALAARAEVAFRTRDWPRAHELYARLDRAADAAEVIPRETLVHRRAALARTAGDDAEAEACYRELAILDPRQVEARQALADLAAARGDHAAAALRLEEVLRLLPLDALEATLAARQRLGELYAGLGDWGAARYYLELLLAQDGARAVAMERLVDAYENLGLFEEAAAGCERLSRLHPQPAKRAEALYRRGTLLLERLHDEPRAFDAFLKSSDLAPNFGPTALRLAAGFWLRGRFDDVAEMADELARTGALAHAAPSLRLRLAIAAAIAGRDSTSAVGAAVSDEAREHPHEAAQALAEGAHGLGAAPPSHLEPAVKLFGAPGGSDGRAVLAALTNALGALLRDDPAAAGGGAARALGWLADRRGDQASARPLYALAAFLGETEGGRARLDELGPCPPVTAAVLALAGGNDHPGVGGTAAPLRRALGTLAHGLAGFGALAARPANAGELGIAAARRDAWHALAKVMAAPPLGLALTEAAPAPHADVAALATRPGLVSIPSAMMTLPDDELTFFVARAFDRLRSGLALVRAITSGAARDIEALLQGAAAALAGRTAPELPLATAAAAELASPDRAAALVGAAPRPRVAGDLLLAEEALVSWEAFQQAAALASDRFALLACRSPLAALQALYSEDGGDVLSPEQTRRAAFLRTPRLRELVAFLTSADYADATRDPARA